MTIDRPRCAARSLAIASIEASRAGRGRAGRRPTRPRFAASGARERIDLAGLERARGDRPCRPSPTCTASTTYRRFRSSPVPSTRRRDENCACSAGWRARPRRGSRRRARATTSALAKSYCGSTSSPKASRAPARAWSRGSASHWIHFASGYCRQHLLDLVRQRRRAHRLGEDAQAGALRAACACSADFIAVTNVLQGRISPELTIDCDRSGS